MRLGPLLSLGYGWNRSQCLSRGSIFSVGFLTVSGRERPIDGKVNVLVDKLNGAICEREVRATRVLARKVVKVAMLIVGNVIGNSNYPCHRLVGASDNSRPC